MLWSFSGVWDSVVTFRSTAKLAFRLLKLRRLIPALHYPVDAQSHHRIFKRSERLLGSVVSLLPTFLQTFLPILQRTLFRVPLPNLVDYTHLISKGATTAGTMAHSIETMSKLGNPTQRSSVLRFPLASWTSRRSEGTSLETELYILIPTKKDL